LKLFKWITTIYGAVFIGLKSTWSPDKAETVAKPFADVWEFVAVWGWLPAALIAALSGPAVWLSKQIQPEQMERILRAILANYRVKAMPPGASEQDFRVTLYKFRSFSFLQFFRWCFGKSTFHPWSGWLCPYVRPGHCRSKSSARWHVSLQNPGESEGVAGKAYLSEEPLIIQKLPEREGVKTGSRRRAWYIKETGTPETWLDKKIEKKDDLFPRSFYGCRVLVDNKPWGVLLFDSEHPEFPDVEGLNADTKDILKVLNSVLSSRT
jgi:hypothetical protein